MGLNEIIERLSKLDGEMSRAGFTDVVGGFGQKKEMIDEIAYTIGNRNPSKVLIYAVYCSHKVSGIPENDSLS